MKCNLPKFVKYQLRLGKLPMMDLYEITPRFTITGGNCTYEIKPISVFNHKLLDIQLFVYGKIQVLTLVALGVQ